MKFMEFKHMPIGIYFFEDISIRISEREVQIQKNIESIEGYANSQEEGSIKNLSYRPKPIYRDRGQGMVWGAMQSIHR